MDTGEPKYPHFKNYHFLINSSQTTNETAIHFFLHQMHWLDSNNFMFLKKSVWRVKFFCIIFGCIFEQRKKMSKKVDSTTMKKFNFLKNKTIWCSKQIVFGTFEKCITKFYCVVCTMSFTSEGINKVKTCCNLSL